MFAGWLCFSRPLTIIVCSISAQALRHEKRHAEEQRLASLTSHQCADRFALSLVDGERRSERLRTAANAKALSLEYTVLEDVARNEQARTAAKRERALADGIANALKESKAQAAREVCDIRRVCEASTELKQLEEALRTAEVTRIRAKQLAEATALREREAAYQTALEEEIERRRRQAENEAAGQTEERRERAGRAAAILAKQVQCRERTKKEVGG